MFPLPQRKAFGRSLRLLFLSWISTMTVLPAEEFFTTKIEPLLKQRCYECHSHASGKMKGGLTLDSKSGWATGGDQGPAIVPAQPAESLLIKMVRWTDEDHQMPPKKKLPEAEISLLEEWVQRGAIDPRLPVKPPAADWWSLRPLVKPEAPKLAPHPLDAFIQAELKAKGLTPAPPADRRTLLRRLYFDLHGLPPSPEEVAAFVANPDPLAYAQQVSKLLASPRYGERWARHWLDTVHFADTHGFEHDDLRPHAWRFRDYVIASLNQDTAWDRFIREQLAADALYPEETNLTPALGFLGAGTYDSSAAATAPTSYEYLDRDDLVTQTMAAFVSTTANCARCHAHKFDPITQEDYFALQAVFAGIGKGDVSYYEDPALAKQQQRWSELKNALATGDEAALRSVANEALCTAWEQSHGPTTAWETLRPETFVSADGATLTRLTDDTILSSGATPDKDTYSLTATPKLTRITALRIDLLTDDSLPVKGPGRASNGNLHLSEVELKIFPPEVTKPEPISIRRALADFDQTGYDVTKAIDGDPKSSWAIHPAVSVPHFAVFEFTKPLTLVAGTRFHITLRQWQGGSHLLGKFKLSITDAPPSSLRVLPAEVEQLLQIPPAQRTEAQQRTIAKTLLLQIATDELSKLPAPVQVWAAGRAATNERGVITLAEPRVIRLLKRGELSKPEAEIGPGALSAVVGLPARFEIADPKREADRRVALANWLADSANPLTWRSIVNRVWHYHFGKGLCDTPNDFGHMGGAPSHPALLDWLAVWFRDEAHGSLKALHQLIVTSAAYQQAATSNQAALAVDPENRLLWRMNRTRLDADTIRDSMLAVSGRLDLTMGGPSIAHFSSKPGPQTTPVLTYENFPWDTPGASRRSIYRLVWRAIADPFMDALDFPDMGSLSPVRGFSASALQALALFNNEFVLHHSAQFAQRLEPLGATPEARLQAAFQLCLQRAASPEEMADFAKLVEPHGLAPACRVLFNSNEFLFLD